ncbi:MAG: translation initiation factor [Thermotogaceae bacterium]|nr:translation initiation factor [Thermotogaceae bacterium]MDN5337047.1 translation initiation factor [Thermotogaceae bacterium]
MGKLRVYELAKKFGMSSKELLNELEELGIDAKSHMTVLDESTVNLLIELYEEENEPVKPKKGTKSKPKKEKEDEEDIEIESKPKEKSKDSHNVPEEKAIEVKEESMSLKDFAEKIKVSMTKIIQDAFMKGVILNPNQVLDRKAMEEIASKYSRQVVFSQAEKPEERKDPFFELEQYYEKLYSENSSELVSRAPIVTVMGHVDHGKTTLLDKIRKTRVAEKEEGGITQSIGAYKVTYNGKQITFIDTPGHEAFTEMRARGAQATDIVVLVVAADDGVMPQTVEAYNHARLANVPIIVAINKIDKPNANVELTKNQLVSKLNLIPEDWGGDTIVVPISAKTGKGIDELLEMILLVAEMNEIKAYPKGRARGVIIESRLDKFRGPVATVIVKDGILKQGDYVVTTNTYGKVRALIDDRGKTTKEAHPSDPVIVMGFEEVPDMHSKLYAVENIEQARKIVENIKHEEIDKSQKAKHVSLEDLFDRMKKGNIKTLNLIIKAESQGSLEAVRNAILKLKVEEIDIQIIHAGIGAVNINDVLLASASDGVILGFRVKPDSKAVSEAEKEGIQIKTYNIIFELIDDLKKALQGMLEPEIVEEHIGSGYIKKVFKIGGVGSVAGVQLTDGYVRKDSKVRIYRNSEEIFEGYIETLKHFKNDVDRVEAPKECGIKFQNFDDIAENDELQFYIVKEVKKELKFIEQ